MIQERKEQLLVSFSENVQLVEVTNELTSLLANQKRELNYLDDNEVCRDSNH